MDLFPPPEGPSTVPMATKYISFKNWSQPSLKTCLCPRELLAKSFESASQPWQPAPVSYHITHIFVKFQEKNLKIGDPNNTWSFISVRFFGMTKIRKSCICIWFACQKRRSHRELRWISSIQKQGFAPLAREKQIVEQMNSRIFSVEGVPPLPRLPLAENLFVKKSLAENCR